MRVYKYILNNKISSIIIVMLVSLLVFVSSQYIGLKEYTNEVISVNAWNFASGNHSVLEMLEYINAQADYNGEFEEQLSEAYLELYAAYQEICKAYRLTRGYGHVLSFENRLLDIQKYYNMNEAIEIHRNIDEILLIHNVAYENLLSYMDDSKVNYNQKIIREWKEVITELNSLDFTDLCNKPSLQPPTGAVVR